MNPKKVLALFFADVLIGVTLFNFARETANTTDWARTATFVAFCLIYNAGHVIHYAIQTERLKRDTAKVAAKNNN